MNPTNQAVAKLNPAFGQDRLLADSVVLTRLDKALGWTRKYSLFPYPFATACCAMEYMSLSMSPYDIDRFGAALPRFSPRQADVLFVVGTVLWGNPTPLFGVSLIYRVVLGLGVFSAVLTAAAEGIAGGPQPQAARA